MEISEKIQMELMLLESLMKNLDIRVKALKELQSDVQRFMLQYEVEIKVWPGYKVYRLANSRHKNELKLINDGDLEKGVRDIIEELTVENVNFVQFRWDAQKGRVPFDPVYEVGGFYDYQQKYRNPDFGVKIFVSIQELVETLEIPWANAKDKYIAHKAAEKIQKQEMLEKQLEELKKQQA